MARRFRIAVILGDGIGKEVMPEGLRALEAAAGRFGIRDGRMFVRWNDGEGITDPLTYEFDAELVTGDARLDVGVPFTEIEGRAIVAFDHRREPGETEPVTSLEASLWSERLRIYGRPAEDARSRFAGWSIRP